ncbi:MAG: aminotransferase class I/II-fold pyridoxal phosphate-dependent enzyme [Mariprofundaceae bacterium]
MRRIDLIEPFRVMQLLERAKELEAEGRHIIHMEIGEPDFPTPAPVVAAARQRLASGDNFYTPSTGAPELQQALADWYADEYGLRISPDRFLITPGTSGAFSLIYALLIDAGESVLLPDPGYPCQRNFVRLAGGEPLNIPVGPETRYHLSSEMVADNWRQNTRAAVVINPGNPTGTLIDETDFAAIAAICAQKDGWLISDEIYHGLTYGEKPPCALQVSEYGGNADHTIVVNGFSKRWAMTGWRVGWVIMPENLLDAARRVMQNIFIAAPTISQYSAISALSAYREVEVMRKAYDSRRRYLLEALPKLGFDIVIEPQGAFYIYANVQRLTHDSRVFCWDMLEKAGVAMTPGEDFGVHRAAEHIRFSYASGLDMLKEGMRRLETPCRQALAKMLKP